MLDFFAGSGTTGHAVMALNARNNGSCRFVLVQIPEIINEGTPAYTEGYRRISDITIERNKRVVAQLQESTDAADYDAKQQLPGVAPEQSSAYRPGFKVYKLAKSRFPRAEFQPDPGKTDGENLEEFNAYIRQKEAAFLMTFDRREILEEVLLKNGFMLDIQTEPITDFTHNVVFRARDSRKEATVCLDYDLKEQTIAKLKGIEGIFICLEQALNTTKKWNLRIEFGERLVAF